MELSDQFMKKHRIPAFGSPWNFSGEVAFATYYFVEEDRDLFQAPNYYQETKVRKSAAKRAKAPKAVDKDLYEISSELLCQRPKKRKSTMKNWLGCLGLNCDP